VGGSDVKAAAAGVGAIAGVRVRIRDRKAREDLIEYHTVNDFERVVEMMRGKELLALSF